MDIAAIAIGANLVEWRSPQNFAGENIEIRLSENPFTLDTASPHSTGRNCLAGKPPEIQAEASRLSGPC